MMEVKSLFKKCLEYDMSQKVKEFGIYPYFRSIEGLYGNQVIHKGRRKIMIGSNNYLGLASDPRVIEASQEATRKYGSGCTGSRFLNGNMKIHDQLEEELADFLNREAVLLFSTGFFANQGALNTLCEEGDFILCDRENHASIVEGCNLSKAKTVPFAHNSYKFLKRRLEHLPKEGGKLIVVDGVFSMSGDISDLSMVVSAAQEFGAAVMVDEAHALGVLGKTGRGAVEHYGLDNEVDLIMGTFSKSLGSMGGFLSAKKEIIEYLKHHARCMIFTASLAPAIVGGVLKALQLLREEPERKDMLWKNTLKMHEGFKQLGFNIGITKTPIVPILIGSEAKAFMFTQRLLEEGIFTTPAVYPAVKYGQAIIRTSYMSTHTDQELDYVLETFEKLAKELGIFEDYAYTGETETKRSYGTYDFAVFSDQAFQTLRANTGTSS